MHATEHAWHRAVVSEGLAQGPKTMTFWSKHWTHTLHISANLTDNQFWEKFPVFKESLKSVSQAVDVILYAILTVVSIA